MGWRETCSVEERMQFVLAARRGEESIAALCRRFEVSRRIGYKWLARFEEEGAAGLFDRSRAPRERSEAIHSFFCAARWIASRSLSSGAHSRDPLTRNDGVAVEN
jgi:hypothetical protein